MSACELLVEHLNADPLPFWPVIWGAVLPPGRSAPLAGAALRSGDGQTIPAQVEVLTRHADGSPCRLLVTAEPALPSESRLRFALTEDPGAPAALPLLSGAAGTLRVAGGEIALDSPAGGLLLDVRARGGPADATREALTWRVVACDPFAAGPVSTAAVIRGALDYRGELLAEVRLTVRLFRRTPVLFCDVLVKNLSANPAILLDEFTLECRRRDGAWTEVTGELRQFMGLATSAPPVSARARKLAVTVIDARGEHTRSARLLNYNESWLAASDGRAQTVLGIRDFFESYPLGAAVGADRISVELWPAWHGAPWRLAQGCGKTHQLMLAVLAENSGLTARAAGYAFGKPPLPRQPLAELQAAGALTELLDYAPNRYPRLETTLYDLTHNRNRGYGKMHYGDDFSALYTNQLRGQGEVVWNNLEGDFPYHMFCQFVRTGHYLYFKEFHASVRHWADVDFRDRGPDPLHEGALVAHSADHVTGGTSPCHNWAEGFREWYFATGDPRPLEVLTKMADWLVRRDRAGAFRMEPEPYVRGCGWGLILMAAIQDVLARADIEAIQRRLCADLLAYCRARHGLPMTMPTGGNWVPKDNAFHTATVVLGAERGWQRYGEPAMRDLAIEAAEAFMDERTCTPEGIAVYITGPEQAFPMQQAATFAMAGLAAAWRLTREARYVRRGMRMLEYCLERGMIVDHMRIPGEFLEIGDNVVLNVLPLMPNSQLLNYQLRGLLQFMKAAHEADLLKSIDYRY